MMLADHLARGGGDGPHFIGPFLLLLLLLLGGFLVARLIRRRRGGAAWPHHHGSPMSTLQDRFARGDIDRAEYEHRKAVLEGAETVPPAPRSQFPPPAPPAPPARGDVEDPVDDEADDEL